ncbi:hypothetical protein BSK52_07620 [Paenibacillus odorifer]|uniref:AraC-type arabinose-binding/dimerisation domain-containing protein n=1 Tax=Paenibacillus odorifer TaxID=189426 RepID=A0A1R0Y5M7_9BACL|nr:hypothetical protein BSK52_07620 [Paenibacillus odorifer]
MYEHFTFVLYGSFRFMIDDCVTKDVQIVTAVDSIHFTSDLLHSCIPLGDCSMLLDAFTPHGHILCRTMRGIFDQQEEGGGILRLFFA